MPVMSKRSSTSGSSSVKQYRSCWRWLLSLCLKSTFDSSVSLHQEVNCTYTTAHSELRCISSIRQHLTTDATNVLFSAFLFSTLDYCQSLLSGAPQYLLDRLQRVQKAAARLAIKASKSDHILLLFCTHSTGCQWLLEYKISSRCYSSLSDSGTKHLSRHL